MRAHNPDRCVQPEAKIELFPVPSSSSAQVNWHENFASSGYRLLKGASACSEMFHELAALIWEAVSKALPDISHIIVGSKNNELRWPQFILKSRNCVYRFLFSLHFPFKSMTPTQLFGIFTIMNKLFTSIRYVEWYDRFLSVSANRLFAAPSQIKEKCNQFLRELVICHAPIRQDASLDIANMVILY
jgi:hypothetical protein